MMKVTNRAGGGRRSNRRQPNRKKAQTSSAATKRQGQRMFYVRHAVVLGFISVALIGLGVKAVHLHWVQGTYLKAKGEASFMRVVTVKPSRGKIVDRNGEILALSSPVDSIYAHPKTLCESQSNRVAVKHALHFKPGVVLRLCAKARGEFMYVYRHLSPAKADAVLAKNIPGVYAAREYKRYYPLGEVAASVVGFTNIDGKGLEGLERFFNRALAGSPGQEQLMKDRAGRMVEQVQSLKLVHHGSDLVTSLDAHLQYLTHRALNQAMVKHQARAAFAVVLKVENGEILAMANVPDFNPNQPVSRANRFKRNFALTDVFEPGSTIKPFTLAMALEKIGRAHV